MKLIITCRESTRLVLEGEDRELSLRERVHLRVHLLICAACPRFVRQVALMRRAFGRWQGYADDDGAPPPA